MALFVTSLVDGPPAKLLGVALSRALIFYVERAALVAFLVIAVGDAAHRLLRGDPIQEACARRAWI